MCWKGGQHLFPPKQDSTQKFLRSKLLGTKLCVKWDDVTVIKVLQFKGPFVREILKFAATIINTKRYVPDYQYSKEQNME